MSTLYFKCNMCLDNFTLSLSPESSSEMDLNSAAVSGAMSIGIGFSNSEELFTAMDIPYLSSNTYMKYQDSMSEKWKESAVLKMEEAARQEAQYARSIGNVDEDGIPFITVVADGCWSKRSYRKNYNALSGAAAIIGQKFGQVLFLGVRNKYCTLCERAKKNNTDPHEHRCFKNFTGSSTSMEADILVEGFKSSVAMYGVKYTTLIADGDSSTYKRILEARPYRNITIEKVECRNHLLRNFCNKLQTLSTDTKVPIQVRKMLQPNIMRLRSAVIGSIAQNKEKPNGIILLKDDLDNMVNHVFGEHSKCKDYFCKRKKNVETNNVPLVKSYTDFWERLTTCIQQLKVHCRSLIKDVDSNVVEQFNSRIAKLVGGKRVNFSLRCSAAVVSFNTSRPHYELHKTAYKKSPSNRVKRLEIKRMRRNELARKKRAENRKLPRRRLFASGTSHQDADYGESCQVPDMDLETYEQQKQTFLTSLQKNEEERATLERETILQSGSGIWMEYRRKLLTASNFYTIAVHKPTTSCKNKVRQLLYGGNIDCDSTRHGRKYESTAKFQLETQENISIEECGLFIHRDYPHLGATPDGLVGSDAVVEIKCPISAFKKPIDDVIAQNKIKFWKYKASDQSVEINTRHSWYYQIQGQLEITNREVCIFGVWTGPDYPLKVVRIKRDRDFWENIVDKLNFFYNECLLPELVDPRHIRHMEIRDPAIIIEAQKKKESGKTTKATKRKLKDTIPAT